jgi:hypothetical protein
MTARIEWRTRGKGKDALLYVGEYGEDENTVLRKWDANAPRLADFLNEMDELDTKVADLEVDVDERAPQGWGKLVLSRAAQGGGDILNIDPELYWDGIYFWFRSKGVDPHPWHSS